MIYFKGIHKDKIQVIAEKLDINYSSAGRKFSQMVSQSSSVEESVIFYFD